MPFHGLSPRRLGHDARISFDLGDSFRQGRVIDGRSPSDGRILTKDRAPESKDGARKC